MFEEKTNKYSAEIRELFSRLNDLILAAAPSAQARLWGGLPSYYVGDSFVRLIPSKDHINIEAAALACYKQELQGYKFTPKNMLCISALQAVPTETLTAVFRDTLFAKQ